MVTFVEDEMHLPTVLYLPTLHANLVTISLPEVIKCIPCGMELSENILPYYDKNVYEQLPFTGKAAHKIVNEMIALGETLPATLYSWHPNVDQQNHIDENNALRAFANTGNAEATPSKPLNDILVEAKIAAQKVLLLGWKLEEQASEIAVLETQVLKAHLSLQESLQYSCSSDDMPEEAEITKPFLFAREHEKQYLPTSSAWKQIFAAALVFAPQNTVFVSGDGLMHAELVDAGLVEPITEKELHEYSFLAEVSDAQWLFATVPAWKLLGYSHEPVNLPWFCKNVCLFSASLL